MTLICTFYRKKKWNPSSTLSMKQIICYIYTHFSRKISVSIYRYRSNITQYFCVSVIKNQSHAYLMRNKQLLLKPHTSNHQHWYSIYSKLAIKLSRVFWRPFFDSSAYTKRNPTCKYISVDIQYAWKKNTFKSFICWENKNGQSASPCINYSLCEEDLIGKLWHS